MSTLTYHYKEKDLRRAPLIENPSKHRLHNAATVKKFLFQDIAMIHGGADNFLDLLFK